MIFFPWLKSNLINLIKNRYDYRIMGFRLIFKKGNFLQIKLNFYGLVNAYLQINDFNYIKHLTPYIYIYIKIGQEGKVWLIQKVI